MPSRDAKRKIAILGGGQAALTAALQLSDPDNPGHKNHEITIYQLGWRLGGKGATGRPVEGPARILEHGLHNWFGFYENTFRQARDVYAALGRSDEFDKAFTQAHTGAQVEWIGCDPVLWQITNPVRPGAPGVGGQTFSPIRLIAAAIALIKGRFDESPLVWLAEDEDPVLARAGELLRAAVPEIVPTSALRAGDLLHLARDVADATADGEWHPIAEHMDPVMATLASEFPNDVVLPIDVAAIQGVRVRATCWLLWLFLFALWRAVRDDIGTDTEARRLWIMANFGYACITGAIRDRVVRDGFDVINHSDLRKWLGAHAFSDDGVMVRSPLVEAVYCGSFAYPEGDTRGPLEYPCAGEMEAGTALRGIVRTLLTYKGAFAYRFAAGTADTFYAPVYEVLKQRDVRFRFFSDVRRLKLEDGMIARIDISEQARVAGGAAYEPLVSVENSSLPPYWPLEPLWDQLDDGRELAARDPDFEWPSDKPQRVYSLVRGDDFTDVVLGISIGALGTICQELVSAYPSTWANAVDHVKTVRTQSLQLWLTQTSEQLGFSLEGKPITNWRYKGPSPSDEGRSPLNVWGDFSELIEGENWPPDAKPLSLGYFCSTMPDEPKFADQAQADERTRRYAIDLLTDGLKHILPGIADADGNVRWDLLVAPANAVGEERLSAQWYRANVTPSERYVLSVVGSSSCRLRVHDPVGGPANLYLAGDWTQCTLNCGCVEAATMSGMLCSHALCAYPPRKDIIGVDF